MIATNGRFRILCLDGGGAKGFYTLGVLRELEAMLGGRLCDKFDLVFGTSTGAIIAALIALGNDIASIEALYERYVPAVMRESGRRKKSAALRELANQVFADASFEDVRMGIGIVATRWLTERPMIFKGSVTQAHGRRSSFVPGFGVRISEAIQASCAAYPFFERKVVTTAGGDPIELIDGGYCANNPTLFAIADAIRALQTPRDALRVVSVGVGVYPQPKPRGLVWRALSRFEEIQLLQKTFEINTQSMDQLREILFGDVNTVRISDTFERPEMATDLMEHNLEKLRILRQRGSDSFASREATLRTSLI